MSYLTDDEKRMEFNMRKAQYFLGMQCSLNKGDGKELKELLNELIDDALQEGRKQGALEELNLFKEWLLKDAIPLHMDKPLVILADKSKLQCEENYISDNSIIKQLEKRIKELEEGSAKTKGFLESPRKKLGDVEK